MLPTSTLPGRLYPSPIAPRGSKRSRSLVKGSFPKAHRRVHFSQGSAVTGTLDDFDGLEADRPGCTSAPRDGT